MRATTSSVEPRPLTRPGVVVATAFAVTGLSVAESTVAPWAPYFWLYAAVCIGVPLAAGPGPFGLRSVRQHWRLVLGVALVATVVDQAVAAMSGAALAHFGLSTDPAFSIDVALEQLLSLAAARLGLAPGTTMGLFAFFVLVWAPVGEELFYRAYLQRNLEPHVGAPAALLLATAVFAARHALQLLYLGPPYPAVAGGVWFTSVFLVGLLLGELYRRTRALAPVMAVHLAVNLVSVALSG
jgi:membrane protease YdiL (CAAX protease family)